MVSGRAYCSSIRSISHTGEFMPTLRVAGLDISYELLGNPGAPAVALTPGGRFGLDVPGLRELALVLVENGRRVLLWDRPNCGASSVSFEGSSESEMQADALIALIEALQLGPTALAAGSAGSRVSLIAAARSPEAVSHLVLWWVSGGILSLMMLGASYCSEAAVVAAAEGMAAVADLPAWKEQIRRNPANREILLSQDTQQFISTMEKWAQAFIPSEESPVPGMSASDFTRLTMPVLIFRGSRNDLYHPARTSEWVHHLIPHSVLVSPPWPEERPLQRMQSAIRSGTGHFLDWPLLAPDILAFLNR